MWCGIMGEKEKLKVFIILLKSDLFDLDSKIIGNFRRKVTKGIVGDDDLGKVSLKNKLTLKKPFRNNRISCGAFAGC